MKQPSQSRLKPLAPASVAAPFGAYSHGLAGRLSRWVTTSGQLGVRPDGTVPHGVAEQAEICFAAIEAILSEADLGLEHVLRVNAYVTKREHMAEYMAARDRAFAHIDPKPCSTLLIVSGFTRPEFLVEVEAIAGAP